MIFESWTVGDWIALAAYATSVWAYRESQKARKGAEQAVLHERLHDRRLMLVTSLIDLAGEAGNGRANKKNSQTLAVVANPFSMHFYKLPKRLLRYVDEFSKKFRRLKALEVLSDENDETEIQDLRRWFRDQQIKIGKIMSELVVPD